MSEQHIELHMHWTSHADTRAACRWLEQRGLAVNLMKSGALLSGSKSAIERAFSTTLDESNPPESLPIPGELQDHVESVRLFKPRSYLG
jgi:hypothetical protein